MAATRADQNVNTAENRGRKCGGQILVADEASMFTECTIALDDVPGAKRCALWCACCLEKFENAADAGSNWQLTGAMWWQHRRRGTMGKITPANSSAVMVDTITALILS